MLLRQSGVMRSLLFVCLLFVIRSVCEQDNSRTRSRMSTKHGKHVQGWPSRSDKFWCWSESRCGSSITFPLPFTLRGCGFIRYIFTRQGAPPHFFPPMQPRSRRQRSSRGGVWFVWAHYSNTIQYIESSYKRACRNKLVNGTVVSSKRMLNVIKGNYWNIFKTFKHEKQHAKKTRTHSC